MKYQKKGGNVFGLGTAALDFRIQTPDMGKNYEEKLLAQEIQIMGGGACANCLVQVSRLGGKAFWLGKLGEDWIAQKILEELEEEGVDCSNIIQDSLVISPFNLAVYTKETLKRVGGFLLPNSLNYLTGKDLLDFSESIDENDWVIIEIGELSLDTVLEFCNLLKSKNIHMACDIDLDPVKQCGGDIKSVKHLLNYFDIIIPNRNALTSIYPGFSAGEVSEMMSSEIESTVIITAGKDGVYYSEAGRRFGHQQASDIEVVDSVGAGDAFHGGLMYGLAQGWNIEAAINLGLKCGRTNCRSFGARAGMLRMEPLQVNFQGHKISK